MVGTRPYTPRLDPMGYYMKSALPVYANTMNTHTLQYTACSRDHIPDMRTLKLSCSKFLNRGLGHSEILASVESDEGVGSTRNGS